MKLPLYQLIARAGDAANYCAKRGSKEWLQVWEDLLAQCEEQLLPSGSGFNAGTKIEYAGSDKIVLRTSFHHMNEHGYYDGWTEHVIVAVPNFIYELDLKVGGRNKNGVKEYIADVFYEVLRREVVYDGEKVEWAD